MDKYVWQAGMNDPVKAMALSHQARVDIDLVQIPMLCLSAEGGDPPECRAQTQTAYEHNPSPYKGIHIFTRDEGADTHCQINNLTLLNQVVFDWLDALFMLHIEDISV